MARITDPKKIENVKRAAMEIITEYGYRNISIAAIAERANVSVGYLYRYYKSKRDLFDDLFNTKLDDIKKDFFRITTISETFSEVVYNFITLLFQLAKKDPVHIQLISIFILNSDMDKVVVEADMKVINQPVEDITKLGKQTGEIGDDISEDEVFLVLMTIPFRYVMLKLKEENSESFFQDEHIKKLSRICCKALK